MKTGAPRAIICGGRDFHDLDAIRELLRGLDPRTVLITGGAPGADSHADALAQQLVFDRIIYPANWRAYGKAAGARRNRLMLTMEPDVVYAFPGGKGTANMVAQAEKLGIPVVLMVERSAAATGSTDV